MKHPILDCLSALEPLGDLPRTGWVVRGVVPAESLAAHTTAVVLLVAMICDELRAEGIAVDGELAMRMALVHDAPEAKTGDIPNPYKSAARTAALAEIENRIADDVLPPGLRASFAAHLGNSTEAQIVRAADKIQMLSKAWSYQSSGRAAAHLFDSMWSKASNLHAVQLPPVRRVYEALFARAGRTLPTS